MADENKIRVEVTFCLPDQQPVVSVTVLENSTLEAAINQSGVLEQFPEIDLAKNKVGVFGKVKPLKHLLLAGDRVEIYRPLIADPKASRRKKAEKEKAKLNNA